ATRVIENEIEELIQLRRAIVVNRVDGRAVCFEFFLRGVQNLAQEVDKRDLAVANNRQCVSDTLDLGLSFLLAAVVLRVIRMLLAAVHQMRAH
ncbi:hypothetical protein PAXRUDRAFT_636347, partial [Paxillus rubicundulus Ve08.2h10]